ncbi:MAG TPA: L,D-transpeptidase [Pyrinomonadaceae bacterium]|nr:L,D-transpeptidase [Pyrinomonadaceae bacterium]
MKSPSKLVLVAIISALSSISCQRGPSSPGPAITAAAQAQTIAPNSESQTTPKVEPTMLPGPNAVPHDTRIVVNIPAFRMDLFRDGALVKSYKIGIGYPEFQLPRGFRKAEMIIFNPTWTQPNESWASNPGEVVPAGAKGNPLGPIKIPIGGANLIHGGKPLAKIGNFASHGCVGMTNEQVKDFAKVLADATGTQLSSETIRAYLRRPTRTQAVKLAQVVPVELRYETIVAQDGKLHIYRDVYNLKTNTEENLRAVLEANGLSFDKLSEDEKSQVTEALNIVSGRPKKQTTPAPLPANASAADRAAAAAARKAELQHQKKLRSQREFVIQIAALATKGYPAAVNLNTGAAESTMTASLSVDEVVPPAPVNRALRSRPATSPTPRVVSPEPPANPANPVVTPLPRTNPTPAPRPTPGVVQPPRSTASPQ